MTIPLSTPAATVLIRKGEACTVCEELHLKHLQQYLGKAAPAKLQFGLDKCEFFVNSTALLGFVVSEEGTKPHPDKLKCIRDWTEPSCDKDVERFLGFVGFYSCFVPRFADRVATMRDAIKTERRGQAWTGRWSTPQQAAFQDLMQLFSNPGLVLSRPRV